VLLISDLLVKLYFEFFYSIKYYIFMFLAKNKIGCFYLLYIKNAIIYRIFYLKYNIKLF